MPLDLIIDGVRVGSTDDGQIVVPAGRRRIELVNKRLNYRGEVTLDVASGQVTTHTATLPPGQLRIAGAAGGEVWVEGEHVGTLPLGDISVPLGTREVLVRHPLFGERRQTVEVTYGAPTQVSMLQQESGAGSPQDAASQAGAAQRRAGAAVRRRAVGSERRARASRATIRPMRSLSPSHGPWRSSPCWSHPPRRAPSRARNPSNPKSASPARTWCGCPRRRRWSRR